MKSALIAITALSIFGCTTDDSMTSPTSLPPTSFPPAPPPPVPGSPQRGTMSIWGMLIGESGACVVDGEVEVVSGQLAGTKIKQDPNCDYWGYSGGFTLENLTPGLPMKLRASAPGYVSLDTNITPTIVSGPQTAFTLLLTRGSH